ncbi:hypothetical protein PS662_03749 [Pseudomonas fluorescens]|uniref:RHS repeat-associated core domain-containing protein n=1 Tax=Pseudomonas fluorescens TaxID=294 RepID=A0A5E6UVM8_PSEFL|nr:RHS repeat-associated core domain-containing protein [Pseudomonas fluorescens]VVN08981.1 hypothetical protein PS662_03749 [Pseudomonas fluorescens]
MQPPRATLLCKYRYDPLDRLVANALPDEPERQRFYCKSRLATEIQGATCYSIVQSGDQLLAQQQIKGGVPETTLLVTDPQRSVLQTLHENDPPQSVAYTPYGGVFLNALFSLLGFNGERRDPVTGHYLLGNGYRAFNPVLTRFNSPDTFSPFGTGGLNTYAYCLGDPVNWDDRTGRSLLLSSLVKYIESQILGNIGNKIILLAPGASRKEALALINNQKIVKQIPKAKQQLQSAFKNDYNAIMNPITSDPSSLKSLSIQTITNSNLSSHELPTALRAEIHPQQYKKLMNTLVDHRFPDTPTISEGRLQTLTIDIERSRDPIFKDIATSYRDEMHAIRNAGSVINRAKELKKYIRIY